MGRDGSFGHFATDASVADVEDALLVAARGSGGSDGVADLVRGLVRLVVAPPNSLGARVDVVLESDGTSQGCAVRVATGQSGSEPALLLSVVIPVPMSVVEVVCARTVSDTTDVELAPSEGGGLSLRRRDRDVPAPSTDATRRLKRPALR
jgi:hypothetical protein